MILFTAIAHTYSEQPRQYKRWWYIFYASAYFVAGSNCALLLCSVQFSSAQFVAVLCYAFLFCVVMKNIVATRMRRKHIQAREREKSESFQAKERKRGRKIDYGKREFKYHQIFSCNLWFYPMTLFDDLVECGIVYTWSIHIAVIDIIIIRININPIITIIYIRVRERSVHTRNHIKPPSLLRQPTGFTAQRKKIHLKNISNLWKYYVYEFMHTFAYTYTISIDRDFLKRSYFIHVDSGCTCD